MSSTTSTAPSSSPSSNQPTPTNDGRTNIVGIVLGIAGVFIVGVIVYTTWRLKRRRSANPQSSDAPEHGTILDRAHPAARITPFGSPDGETPRYKHTPGEDMRIATRRPDGAWQFSDPQTPFTPTGVWEIDVLPSPSSSTGSMLPSRPHRKEREASREARKGYDRDYDPDLNPPPPAYGYDYGGYINHAKP